MAAARASRDAASRRSARRVAGSGVWNASSRDSKRDITSTAYTRTPRFSLLQYDPMESKDTVESLLSMADELRNFQEIVKNIIPLPGEIPTLNGIDVHGG